MTSHHIVPLALTLFVPLACQSQSAAKKTTKTSPPAKAEQKMTPPPATSPTSEQTLEPVKGADVAPLPAGAWMRFQEIKLAGEGCSSNYRFLLYDDGRFFLQENSSKDDCAARPKGSAFNEPMPKAPKKTLDDKALQTIRDALSKQGFASLPASIAPPAKVFDGSMKIMEVRDNGKVRRVISVKGASKAIESILELIWKQIY